MKECKGWDLYPPQLEVSRLIISSLLWGKMEERYVEFSRQSGKTEMTACIIVFCSYHFPLYHEESKKYDNEITEHLSLFKNGFKTGIFAPGLKQAGEAYDRSVPVVEFLIDKYKLDMKIHSRSKYRFPLGSDTTIYTAKLGAKIEGPSLHFIHIDEAQDVFNVPIEKSILPMGTNTRATVLFTGVPTNEIMGHRYFHDALHNPALRDFCHIYDYKEFSKYSKNYKDYVEKRRQTLGEDNINFRIAYLLEWPIESLSFTNRHEIESLGNKNIQRRVSMIRRPQNKELYDNIFVGVDVGEYVDSTVIFVLQLRPFPEDPKHPYRIRLINLLEIKGTGMELQEQAEMVAYPFLKNYSIVTISYDYTGMGRGFCENLVREFKKGNLPQHEHTHHILHQWNNLNHNDLFGRLHTEWKQGRFEYPDDGSRDIEEFKKQFLYLGYELKHGSLIRCESTSSKVHDDICSSAALAINSIGIDYFEPSKTGRKKKDTTVRYVGGDRKKESKSGRIRKPSPRVIMPRSYRGR